jgi:hypothetical protein
MMFRMRLAATLLTLVLPLSAPALAQQVKPVCVKGSRACLIRTVSIYLDGLSRHDASAIPFAPSVRCTEQGNIEVTHEAKFRSEINASKDILGSRNVRLLVDEATGSVGAFYMLDIGPMGDKPAFTVRRGQRFKVVKGLITEVEVYNFFDQQGGKLAEPLWPDEPAR